MKWPHRLDLLLMLCILLMISACGKNNTENQITELSRDKIFYSGSGTTTSGGTLRELYVINADNTEGKQLTFTDDGSPKSFIGLTNNGFVVYMYNNSIYSVPIVNPSPLNTKKIASDPYIITPLNISSDNRVIYYAGWNLRSVKADGTETSKSLNSNQSSSSYVGISSNNLVVYWDDNGLYAIPPDMSQPAITLSTPRPGQDDVLIYGTLVVFYNNGNTPGIYKIDLSSPLPQKVLLTTVDRYYALKAVKAGYIVYTAFTTDSFFKIWKTNMDGTGSTQLTTSSGDDDYFIALSSDNRVIYQKQSGTDTNIYSVAVTSGIETLIAANASTNDYVGATNDNRVIVQYAVDPLFRTIISVKSDGSSPVTLASGNSGTTAGGYVWLVTPDGWVIYEKGLNSETMTSVKADNSARGTFENFQGKMGVTSTNRIIATMLDGNKLKLFSVKGNGTEKLLLNTENVESLLMITP